MTNTSLYCKVSEYVSVNNNLCELLNHIDISYMMKTSFKNSKC